MPERLTESDLLALIEGDLPADRVEVVRAALNADPRLVRLVESLVADRRGLRALAGSTDGVRAPAGLVRDAMDEAERRMLLEVGSSSPRMVVESKVGPSPRVVGAWRGRRWTPALAAAGFLLMVGGVWVGLVIWNVGPRAQQQRAETLAANSQHRTMSINPSGAPAPAPEPPAAAAEPAALPPIVVASGGEAADGRWVLVGGAPGMPRVPVMVGPALAGASGAGDSASSAAAASGVAAAADGEDPGLAAAVRLALENRLILRVDAADVSRTAARAAVLSQDASAGNGLGGGVGWSAWRARGPVPTAVANAASADAPQSAASGLPGAATAAEPSRTGPAPSQPGPEVVGPVQQPPETPGPAPAQLYTIDLTFDPAHGEAQVREQLVRLVAALSQGGAAKVTPVEAEGFVSMTGAGRPSLRPADVLWWSRPPSAWATRAGLSVAVEIRPAGGR
ncbi:MAG: hypothetical protein IBJ11_06030 [Phycisphaerales bacterium]|nr:hypothetical protein [Phycisphaerales bacterium]